MASASATSLAPPLPSYAEATQGSAQGLPAASDVPEVTILLLGDSDVGKSAFLARLSQGLDPSPASLKQPLFTLRDTDQPFTFSIRMYNRPYRFLFYDTASPSTYTLLRPDFIVLCYSVVSRRSLTGVKTKWKEIVEGHFNYDENLPVMLLGLKRDLRDRAVRLEQARVAAAAAERRVVRYQGDDEDNVEGFGASNVQQGAGAGIVTVQQLPKPGGLSPNQEELDVIYPQEALNVAQEMRLDRYAECSALTGELCREVMEDISRAAARTTTAKGGRSDPPACALM